MLNQEVQKPDVLVEEFRVKKFLFHLPVRDICPNKAPQKAKIHTTDAVPGSQVGEVGDASTAAKSPDLGKGSDATWPN